MKNKFAIFSIVVSISLAYRSIFSTYFQQDEWVGFGQALTEHLSDVFGRYSLLDILSARDRLIGLPINYALFWLAPFKSWPFALFAIVLHSINAVLVYHIAYKLTKSIRNSFITGLFFALAFISHQSLTWFAAGTTTLTSTAFVLLSLYFILEFRDRSEVRYAYLCQLCAIISAYFKESSLFLILYLPVFFRLTIGKKAKLRDLWPFFLMNAYLMLYKVAYFFSPIGKTGEFVSQDPNAAVRLAMNGVFYPLLAVSQVFIPPRFMFTLASKFQSVMYGFVRTNTASEAIAVNIVADYMSLFLSFAMLAILIWLAGRNDTVKRILFLGLLLVVLSVIPYVVLHKGSSYLDSRYYYVTLAGASLIVLGISESLATFTKFRTVITWSFIIFFSSYMWKNVQLISRELEFQRRVSAERLGILHTVKSYYPRLPDNPVIYLTGNRTSYYGIEGLSVPFQIGPGYTFMVYYYQSGNIPGTLIRENYLTHLKSSGYSEADGKGFGYFTDMKQLRNEVKKNNITPGQIIALYYDSDTMKLQSITPSVLAEIYE